MPIDRKQYITIDELNEILFTSYPDDDEIKKILIEASELISYHTNWQSDRLLEISDDEIIGLIKIATAYQFEYFENMLGIDIEYIDGNSSTSCGSISFSNSNARQLAEWKKIAPKTNRYLTQAGALYSGFCRGGRYYNVFY